MAYHCPKELRSALRNLRNIQWKFIQLSEPDANIRFEIPDQHEKHRRRFLRILKMHHHGLDVRKIAKSIGCTVAWTRGLLNQALYCEIHHPSALETPKNIKFIGRGETSARAMLLGG